MDQAGHADPLAGVRVTCARVAAVAEQVEIDLERIPSYALGLASETNEAVELDPEHHFLCHGAKTATYILTLEAVNFGSGYFPHLIKRPGESGYFTIASHLKHYFEEQDSVTVDTLASWTPYDCAKIFHQSGDDPDRAELMRLFAESVNELAGYVATHFAGSFPALIEHAACDAAALVALLARIPTFDDVATYRGQPVALYKRAQIAVSDLDLAFRGGQWGSFSNLADLTVFADNVLPHVLRTDGVLRYRADLADRVDRGELLRSGSPEEVEIRACTVNACEQIVAHARQLLPGYCARDLDPVLWHRGHGRRYQSTLRHRCRTVFY
jgi:hypothetical protein